MYIHLIPNFRLSGKFPFKTSLVIRLLFPLQTFGAIFHQQFYSPHVIESIFPLPENKAKTLERTLGSISVVYTCYQLYNITAIYMYMYVLHCKCST